MSDQDKIKCPKCASTQVHAEKRGWNMTTGMLGAGKIVLTCLKCGHKFKPGEGVLREIRPWSPCGAGSSG